MCCQMAAELYTLVATAANGSQVEPAQSELEGSYNGKGRWCIVPCVRAMQHYSLRVSPQTPNGIYITVVFAVPAGLR